LLIGPALNLPSPGNQIPRRHYGPLRSIGLLWMRISGWRVIGELPNEARGIAVVAPHSSNWDFVHAIAAVFSLGLRVQFMGKHTLFRGPLGIFMRWVGGMPVDRADPQDIAERVAQQIQNTPQIWLGITPEGTRSAGRSFKSGFHRIARAADVPILPVALNYRKRVIEFLPAMKAGEDAAAEVEHLRALLMQHGCRREHARR
jgi:1-acyl-sn-glycerol-3-phosphate acyltransferase